MSDEKWVPWLYEISEYGGRVITERPRANRDVLLVLGEHPVLLHDPIMEVEEVYVSPSTQRLTLSFTVTGQTLWELLSTSLGHRASTVKSSSTPAASCEWCGLTGATSDDL